MLERYDRQLRIAGWDQSRLQNGTVVIVGVGALGCEVAKNLALMGVGRLVLIDNDYVELSNLSRQMLFNDGDIGRPKASTAAAKLKLINPEVDVESIDGDARNVPEETFKQGDVICSCLDSWGVRRWLNSLCVSIDRPMVDGGIDGFYGNVHVIIPKKTACLECHGENLISREERLAECTLRRRRPEELVEDLKKAGIEIGLDVAEELFRHNIKTIYDLKYTRLESMASSMRSEIREFILQVRDRLRPRIPALQSVAATIASVMSTETVKLLHRGALGGPMRGLLVYDALSCRMSRVKLKRRADCIVCGDYVNEKPEILEVSGYDLTVSELKEIIANRYGFPDPELLYKARRLSDEAALAEIGLGEEDTLYISTSRRHLPLPIKIKITKQQT